MKQDETSTATGSILGRRRGSAEEDDGDDEDEHGDVGSLGRGGAGVWWLGRRRGDSSSGRERGSRRVGVGGDSLGMVGATVLLRRRGQLLAGRRWRRCLICESKSTTGHEQEDIPQTDWKQE